ncbi:MAG: class I SAM-dependent DNA methyltransferase [Clostridiales bacterium]|nr:class I SAM-dependent DNA methyltransferase [Clostridiales bacterium]
MQSLASIRNMADAYLNSLGYPEAKPQTILIDEECSVSVYLEMTKANGAPLLWVLLAASKETEAGIMESFLFDADKVNEDSFGGVPSDMLTGLSNEEITAKIFFGSAEPPRFIMFIGMNQIALIDRNKWNAKSYLQFELEDIFSRLENTTLQAMAVLLHRETICPDDGKILLDEFDEQSRRNNSGVSQDLKYALRESIELLGNEVLYDMTNRLNRNLDTEPVDAGQLTLECLRYMYRMLFVLFIESRSELGYAPMKVQSYVTGYSLESLRDIADNIRENVNEVSDGYYLYETLSKLYDLIYNGYPKTEEEMKKVSNSESYHDIFLIAPLKAHIFDPEYTKMINNSKLRNSCMLRIIDLMSVTRSNGRRNSCRGRISYTNLGINQMGAVYEALLSYRGFIAEEDLYKVKRAGDNFNELEVGYFVSESELEHYTEEERVRFEQVENRGKLRMYKKGSFIYRLAGREREKSASYYTPESLTRCLVEYALKELLKDKRADEILELTVCEPDMGSAAFLNETINQLAEAYITQKEKETGSVVGYENRYNEIQKVKMYIADRNVYGIDLNPVAVELAEVSLWLNTIYKDGYVPWFDTQLINGNSLIGARRQCYRIESLITRERGLRWYENAPERVPLGKKRMPRKQVYHFLLGDPGMCSYSDKVIKKLEPVKIKYMKEWNKKFCKPYNDDEIDTLLRLSAVADDLWEKQIELRRKVKEGTLDALSVYGHKDTALDSHTTIRQKDEIYSKYYKSDNMKNAGPYARLKFAMDYWWALWFWPIDKAELLPSRAEFLFDMSLILEGTTDSVVVVDNETRDKNYNRRQLSLFPTEKQQMEDNIYKQLYETIEGKVDISGLRKYDRLGLAYSIAEQNHFMHWELEFADLFEERGGFDLIIGNPPWIKIEWNEQGVLSDRNPAFAIKNLSATQTAKHRDEALSDTKTRSLYFSEYEATEGQKNFLNAYENYPDLKGHQTNLYKCFLPQAWMFDNNYGVSAFVHPEGVYDDPKGGVLREKLYPRLCRYFMFTNERKLFPEVDHHAQFSLNVYGAPKTVVFDTISNLFDVKTIAQCYEGDSSAAVPGIKDKDGNWNVEGHPDRIIHTEKKELTVFAKLFDGSSNWKQARLPVLHAKQLVNVLECFAEQKTVMGDFASMVSITLMWDETNAQKTELLYVMFIFRKIH